MVDSRLSWLNIPLVYPFIYAILIFQWFVLDVFDVTDLVRWGYVVFCTGGIYIEKGDWRNNFLVILGLFESVIVLV